MLTTQLDLLKRLGGRPLDEVVEALRDIHRTGADSRDYLSRVLGTPPAPQNERTPRAPAPRAIELAHDVDYEAARRHFVDHGRRLREQALLAERLLDRFAQSKPDASGGFVHDMVLAAPVDGLASTRFVLVNRERQSMRIRFDVDRGEAEGLGTRLRFEPASPLLAPGEELDVRLSADLSGLTAGRRTEVGVDVRNADQLLVKLWIRADVTAADGSDAHAG